MGIFDRFRGSKKDAGEQASASDAAAAAAVSPTLELADVPTPQTDASAKLLGFNQDEAGRLYNPYEGELPPDRCAPVAIQSPELLVVLTPRHRRPSPSFSLPPAPLPSPLNPRPGHRA